LIWKLHKYLTKDLIRTGLLAAVAFTLVMSLFAIIEPMRKQGLGAGQVLRLFWYLLPVMMSLTLPIAALLAATMVYGRFSMDNELTACRASGVSVYTLLKPGLTLGALLALLTLALTNWVAPIMLRKGEEVGRANLQQLVFQNLRSKGHVKFSSRGGPRILYADRADPQSGILRGVVAVEVSAPGDVKYVVARAARATFVPTDAGTQVTFLAKDVTVGEQPGAWMARMEQWSVGPYRVPPLLQENPSFYDWQILSAIRRDPMRSAQVRLKLKDILCDLRVDDLYDDVAATIGKKDKQGYAFILTEELDPSAGEGTGKSQAIRYRFKAPVAAKEKGKLVLSGGPGAAKSDRPVTYEKCSYIEETGWSVGILRVCARAEIDASYDAAEDEYTVRVRLQGIGKPKDPPAADTGPESRQEKLIGPLTPARALEKRRTVTLEELYTHPEQFPSVEKGLTGLREFIQRLHLKILAEMHGRIAYGLGCFLLVAAGAAMGLIFRGGHILSAFAISCVPALALVVLLITGKQLVVNPDTSAAYGVAVIWSGVAILGGMVSYLYGVVLRR